MHPILFKIGNFSIGTYGVIISIGAVMSLLLSRRLARREAIDPDFISDIFVYSLLSALIGAKVAMIVADFPTFLENPLQYLLENLRSFGAFYGGLVTGLLVAIAFVKKKKIPLLRSADVFMSPLVLGQAIGRIGCFFAGCCYGKPTSLPWGIIIPDNPLCEDGTRLHPVQIYSSIADFSLFFVLYLAFFRKKFDGQILCLYLILYPITRFTLELFRGDEVRGLLFGGLISVAQLISIIILPIGILLYIFLKKHSKNE